MTDISWKKHILENLSCYDQVKSVSPPSHVCLMDPAHNIFYFTSEETGKYYCDPISASCFAAVTNSNVDSMDTKWICLDLSFH